MDNSNSHKGTSEKVVECLEDVSFVVNSIHLWLEGRVVRESCVKYFTYELSNHLVSLTLILTVKLVPSISSRPSMNHPTKRLITQGQSDLCLHLFVVTVPILDLFYLCSMCLGGIVAHSSHQDL